MTDAIIQVVNNRAVVRPGGAELLAALILGKNEEAVAAAAEATQASETATEQADLAAASVGAVVTSAAQAVAAAEATAEPRIFLTKADATAAVGGLPADQVVQVLADESRGGMRTVYRKESGALDFKLVLSPNLEVTLEQFGAVGDCDPVSETGTDDSAAMSAALQALYAAGGGTLILGARWYRMTDAFLLANTNTLTAIGYQPAIRLVGQGCSTNGGTGASNRWTAASGLFWTAEEGAAVAKIDTRGLGTLTFEDLDLGSVGLTKPFVHTTFTTLYAQRTGFVTKLTGTNCTEDAFIFGGQTDHEADSGFDRRSSDAGFQGYGTAVTRCYFNGIRRAAVFQRHSNSIVFSDNNIWGACGNDSATGAAIEADGAPVDALTYSVGNVVTGNLIEQGAYKTGLHLVRCNAWYIAGNSGYDAEDTLTNSMVVLGASCINMTVIAGLRPPSRADTTVRPYLEDPDNQVAVFLSSFADEPSVIRSLTAGEDSFPNTFGNTRFNGALTDPVTFQSRQAELTTVRAFQVLRSDADTDAGEVIFAPLYGGGILIGGPSAGNIRNENAAGALRGASWWEGGRAWGFDRTDVDVPRREGSNMRQDSGTGGSYFDLYNFGVRLYDHTGAHRATFQGGNWNLLAGAYLIGGDAVVGARLAALPADATDLASALTLVNAIKSRLQASTGHGLVAG